MNRISLEDFTYIMAYLPMIDKLNCNTVCKKWHEDLSKDQLYHSLTFTNENQLDKAIQFFENNRAFGKLTRNLYISDFVIENTSVAASLFSLFPNLRRVEWIENEVTHAPHYSRNDKKVFKNDFHDAWTQLDSLTISASMYFVNPLVIATERFMNLKYIDVTVRTSNIPEFEVDNRQKTKIIISNIGKAPVLETLVLRNTSLTLVEMEELHSKVLHLKTVELINAEILPGSCKVISPATNITAFHISIATTRAFIIKQETKCKWFSYFGEKYKNVQDFGVSYDVQDFVARRHFFDDDDGEFEMSFDDYSSEKYMSDDDNGYDDDNYGGSDGKSGMFFKNYDSEEEEKSDYSDDEYGEENDERFDITLPRNNLNEERSDESEDEPSNGGPKNRLQRHVIDSLSKMKNLTSYRTVFYGDIAQYVVDILDTNNVRPNRFHLDVIRRNMLPPYTDEDSEIKVPDSLKPLMSSQQVESIQEMTVTLTVELMKLERWCRFIKGIMLCTDTFKNLTSLTLENVFNEPWSLRAFCFMMQNTSTLEHLFIDGFHIYDFGASDAEEDLKLANIGENSTSNQLKTLTITNARFIIPESETSYGMINLSFCYISKLCSNLQSFTLSGRMVDDQASLIDDGKYLDISLIECTQLKSLTIDLKGFHFYRFEAIPEKKGKCWNDYYHEASTAEVSEEESPRFINLAWSGTLESLNLCYISPHLCSKRFYY